MAASADIDYAALAKLADGYSGDDIAGVCRDSAMASMRKKVAGKTPAQIRSALSFLQACTHASSPGVVAD